MLTAEKIILHRTENYSLSMNPICSAPGSHTFYDKIPPYLHEHPRDCPRWTMTIGRLLTEVTGLDSSEADGLPQKICVVDKQQLMQVLLLNGNGRTQQQRSKRQNNLDEEQRQLDEAENYSLSTMITVEPMHGELVSHEVRHTRRSVTVMLNGVPVRMQLDTASDVTMVSEAVWDRIGRPATHPSTHRASCGSGRNLVLREFDCSVTIDEIVAIARIFVTTSQLNLLGINLINQFNLWSLPMDKFCDQMYRGSEDSQAKSPTVSTIRTA
ncbi:hypothetical protein quinque_008639 [Culex quinquefasciatus]